MVRATPHACARAAAAPPTPPTTHHYHPHPRPSPPTSRPAIHHPTQPHAPAATTRAAPSARAGRQRSATATPTASRAHPSSDGRPARGACAAPRPRTRPASSSRDACARARIGAHGSRPSCVAETFNRVRKKAPFSVLPFLLSQINKTFHNLPVLISVVEINKKTEGAGADCFV